MKRLMKITALFLAVLMVISCSALAAAVEVNSASVVLQVEENWFAQPTVLYNHEMAQASMLLSYAACSGPEAVENALQADDVGFDVVDSYSYSAADYALGFTIAKKVIGEETVYAVIFEDTKEKSDWENAYNFAQVNDSDSEETKTQKYETDVIVPFYNWAVEALSVLNEVLEQDGMTAYDWDTGRTELNGNCSFWITGFGRGGSAANLMGAMLNGGVVSKLNRFDDLVVVGTDRVRTYSFAAPAVSRCVPENGDMFNNLFVINNPDDLLVYFPGWGFDWFGVKLDLRTFGDVNNQASEEIKAAVSSNYKLFSGKAEYYAYSYAPETDRGETTEDMLTVSELSEHILTDIAPTMAEFFEIKEDAVYYANLDPNAGLSGQIPSITAAKLVDISTYEILCRVFSAVFGNTGREGIVDLLAIVAPTYLNGLGAQTTTPYFDTIEFAMKHGLDIYEPEDILGLVQSGGLDNLTFREMLTAYEPETYLAWMMATNNAEELSMADLPKDEVTIDSFADNTVTYSTENASGLATRVAAAAYTAEGKLLEVLFGDLGETETVEFTTAETIGKVKVFLVDDQWVPLAPADEKTATEVQ